jgi:hypothetical protein
VNALKPQYPWIVHITTTLGNICTGTYIRIGWVLTAASCVYSEVDTVSEITVSVERDASGSFVPGTWAWTLPVLQVYVPDLYDNADPESDWNLALLRVTIPDNLFTLQPIDILNSTTGDSLISVGSPAMILGYGNTDIEGTSEEFASTLQRADVHIMALSDCLLNPDPALLCAGGTGVGPCQGDEGGPLVVQQVTTTTHANGFHSPLDTHRSWKLVGIATRRDECNSTVPGLFENLLYSDYYDWINENFASGCEARAQEDVIAEASLLRTKTQCVADREVLKAEAWAMQQYRDQARANATACWVTYIPCGHKRAEYMKIKAQRDIARLARDEMHDLEKIPIPYDLAAKEAQLEPAHSRHRRVDVPEYADYSVAICEAGRATSVVYQKTLRSFISHCEQDKITFTMQISTFNTSAINYQQTVAACLNAKALCAMSPTPQPVLPE